MSAWKLVLGIFSILLAGASAKADEPTNSDEESTLAPVDVAAVPKTTTGPSVSIAHRADGKPLALDKSDRVPTVADGVINVGKVEKVVDRYPDGKIHVEREMGLDAKGNYINQGSYKMYDTDGQIVREGDFVNGRQQGKWTRRLAKDEGHLFSPSPNNEYTGPFTSEATFLDGQLHGVWTIKDSAGQKIVEWSFDKNSRSGIWTWWHSNGKKRLEATYRSGALNGDVVEFDRDEKEGSRASYIDGKHLVKVVGWYTLGQKQYEGYHLHAESMPEPTYDWWRSTVTTAAATAPGPDQKHGTWITWHRNGTKETQAQYDHETRIGKFQWWYENGQPQAEGDYENGKKIGSWTTWHPNGQKESLGEYQNDQLVGKFVHWDQDGKLIEGQVNYRQPIQVQTPQLAPEHMGSRLSNRNR